MRAAVADIFTINKTIHVVNMPFTRRVNGRCSEKMHTELMEERWDTLHKINILIFTLQKIRSCDLKLQLKYVVAAI